MTRTLSGRETCRTRPVTVTYAPAAADILNDALLGLAILTAGLVIWISALLISDPDQVIRKLLVKQDR